MEFDRTWEIEFEKELAQAQAARMVGNEGRARVCARRAAGIVAGEYFTRLDLPSPGPSAIDRLRSLVSLAGLPDDVYQIAGHFLLRITTDWALPVRADLIAEARWLANKLLTENLANNTDP